MQKSLMGVAALALITTACTPADSQTPDEAGTAGMSRPAAMQGVKPDVAIPDADAVDQREIIYLNGEQREHLFEEMRDFLDASQSIMASLGENDMQAVIDTANGQRRGNGKPGIGVRWRVPEAFFQMAQQTRQGFGNVADVAQETGDPKKVAGALGETMMMCNACHTTWQVREKN